ncbi:hypothetical protein IFM89_019410 [Coptis chinensis]|uniref:F-box/LRR-repeat protein 15/At3g58940/PEG3-like LRR domain-containing protein n=1 Tax=Coptis chinensis TaxID=261450 RepID=A0A835MBW1_9MAGN|nr:hypothetical protein IFM89_019410 [Coptis chinensis]
MLEGAMLIKKKINEQCSDKRLPLFEELGRSCRNCDKEAFAIAEFLPQLRFLRLVECTLTDSGLQAILNGCPQLEYIVLRNCFNINLGGNLLKRCVLRGCQFLWKGV